MRKWFIIIILGLLLLLPVPAVGQAQVTFNTLQVDIRPEYDRPTVLVMYDIELPQTSVGNPVSLRIPASAGAPYALANGPGDGSLFDLQYERQVSGDWAYIKFTPTMSFVRLEYYDSAFQTDSDARSYRYIWPGDYAVGAMTILVMQPWDATQMQIAPGQWTSQVDSSGLAVFGSEVGQVPASEEIEITISYQKTTDDLTSEHLTLQPSGDIPEAAGTSFQWQEYIPWLLGILGAVMLGGGLFWYFKTGRQEQTPSRKRRRTQPKPPASDLPSAPAEAQGGYCHQCGNRTAISDRFCRACGAKLRGE